MLYTEWNWEDAKEVWCEEVREEVRIEERKYILNLLSEGLSAEEIKQRLLQNTKTN